MEIPKARAHRMTRLVLALAAAGILAGLVFAPAASAATGDFVISGRGNGQGQGMSQWGAWQGARLGKTYQEILAFYYPGTTLSTVSSVAPSREIITVRITTGVDTFASVRLTAAATPATLVDSTGATITSLAVGDSVTLVYNGNKVQVSGSDTTYTYVDLKPDSDGGRVTVTPSNMTAWSKARSYWGLIRVLPDLASGQVKVHNVLPIDKFVAGVSEISPDWAVPSSTSYYAPEAVKAQDVAARTYIAAHSGAVPYDDTRDMNYVGYNFEASYPYATQAAQETAGVVLTYSGKLISAHFSGHSGGYTTNSAWSDTGGVSYEPAQPDPWSLTAPPTNPGYAWTVTMSPTTLASELALGVGTTITQVDVIERDTADPASHARKLRVTGSTGTATISARTFRSRVGLRSTLILSVIKDGSLNHYEQNDGDLGYTGNWTVLSTSGASGGSYRRANASGASVTVNFNGTYLEWIATKGTTLGKALVSLDGATAQQVNLAASAVAYQQKVWNTGTLSSGEHAVTISWDPSNTAGKYISVDGFNIDGSIVPVPPPPPLNHYEQNNAGLFYLGNWTATTATGASGGSFRYTDGKGSCTVSFDGTYLAWLGKKSPVYGKAEVYVDGVAQGTVDLYGTSATYGKVWDTGTLPSGRHTVTIAWTGRSSAPTQPDYNVSVDAFDIRGTIAQAPPRYQQGAAALDYTGAWTTFTASGASGGSYLRSSTTGASVTITFEGSYLVWIATKGTTLSKALVSLDGGPAKTVDLAGSTATYQQKVWNTGILPWGQHKVTITRSPSDAAGKFISVDAIDLVGVLK